MKMRFRHILTILITFLMSLEAFAQEKADDSIDADLDIYEVLCGMCMDLRTRINEGETVSRSEAQAFINRFLAMNRELKEKEERMDARQRRRFVSVGQWFSTGVKPVEHLPVMNASLALYDKLTALSSYGGILIPDMSAHGSVAGMAAEPGLRTILLAEASAPMLSFGFRAGLMNDRFGGYVSLRSDFHKNEYAYTCNSDGKLPGSGMFWPGDDVRQSTFMANAGLLLAPAKWLTIYLGAGYGQSSFMWEDVRGNWAQVSDISFRGMSAEAGAVFAWKRLAFSAGISTVAMETCAFTFGIGVKL